MPTLSSLMALDCPARLTAPCPVTIPAGPLAPSPLTTPDGPAAPAPVTTPDGPISPHWLWRGTATAIGAIPTGPQEGLALATQKIATATI